MIQTLQSAARRAALLAAFAVACAAPGAHALTAADSGWVNVWNGDATFKDFYIYSGKWIDIKDQGGRFKVETKAGEPPVIHTSAGYSLLTTLKEYAYYKVRVEYQFNQGTTGGNAGLMILMDNTAAKTVQSNTRPRSIEINCRRDNNYPWSLWAGRGYGPYMTTTIKAGTADQYVPTGGTLKTMDISADNNRVIRSANPSNELPGGQWNRGEAWVYGDSGVFMLNGQLRTASWGWVTKKGDPSTRTASGGIAVQSEGTEVRYRNWQVMELDPKTHLPVNVPHAKFTLRRPNPSRSVLALDRGSLEAVLREAPAGEDFRWLSVYTAQGRRVASMERSQADPARFHWSGLEGAREAGPYLLHWTSGR